MDVAIYIRPDIDNPYPLTNEFLLYMFVWEEDINLIVDVDGKKYYVTSYDGCAEVVLSDLVMGDNNVTISVAGEDSNISQVKAVIHIEGYAIEVKNENQSLKYISILLPEDADGNLTVYNAVYDEYSGWIKGSQFMTVKLIDGKAIIDAEDIGIGVFDFYVAYESPSDDYVVETRLIHPSVMPKVNMKRNSVVGENVTISIDMPGSATGVINIYLYDDEEWDWLLIKTVDATNNFKTNISSFKFGCIDVKLEYVGEDFKNPFVFFDEDDGWRPMIFSHWVLPLSWDISQGLANGSAVITLELPEGLSGKITVEEGDEDVEIFTILDHAPFTSANKTVVITGLIGGWHHIIVSYVDDNCGAFCFSSYIYVPKPDAGANFTIPETITGDSLDVTLPKDATGYLFVTIDGKTTYMPLVNGTAKVDLSELADGNHTISIKYSGDGNYSEFVKSANVTVKKEVPPAPEVPAKIVAKDLAAYYNKVSYSVTVYGTDGKLASGVLVTFKVDGKKVGTAKTNAKGVATIKLSQLPKTYKITSEALGKSVTKKLTVKQVLTLKKVNVKRSAKKLVLTATLKEGKKAIKGKKITFKFKNKKYTVKTNKKGIAKVTVKKSVLKKLKKGKKVTYQATYLKDTVKRTVKVKK